MTSGNVSPAGMIWIAAARLRSVLRGVFRLSHRDRVCPLLAARQIAAGWFARVGCSTGWATVVRTGRDRDNAMTAGWDCPRRGRNTVTPAPAEAPPTTRRESSDGDTELGRGRWHRLKTRPDDVGKRPRRWKAVIPTAVRSLPRPLCLWQAGRVVGRGDGSENERLCSGPAIMPPGARAYAGHAGVHDCQGVRGQLPARFHPPKLLEA